MLNLGMHTVTTWLWRANLPTSFWGTFQAPACHERAATDTFCTFPDNIRTSAYLFVHLLFI